MKRLLILLLFAIPLHAGPKKPPKPKFVEDKVPGHHELTGHHWACPKGWEVATEDGYWLIPRAHPNPIVCVPAKPTDSNGVVIGSAGTVGHENDVIILTVKPSQPCFYRDGEACFQLRFITSWCP